MDLLIALARQSSIVLDGKAVSIRPGAMDVATDATAFQTVFSSRTLKSS